MPPPLPRIPRDDRRLVAGAGLVALSLAAAPAWAADDQPKPAAKPASSSQVYDPWEHLNRRFFASHDKFDRRFIRPVAMAYGKIVPKFLRIGLGNFLSNLREPVVFANDVMQLRFKTAGKTVARFVANSTFGLGGTVDMAKDNGLPRHDNGFGDTLGHYGVGPGPYLYLPLTGPTDVRDLLAAVVDRAAQPVNYTQFHGRTAYLIGTGGANMLQQRIDADADLIKIDEMGTDAYATLRSLYLQNRAAEIKGEPEIKVEDLPDFGAAPEPEPETAPQSAPQSTPDSTPEPEPPSAAPGP